MATVNEVNKLIKVHVTHFSIYRLGFDTSLCVGDSEPEGDVDGTDLWEFIAGGCFEDIADFAASFGHTDCQ